jgi:hypothetical protein
MNRVDAVEFLDANKAEEAIRSAVNAGAIAYAVMIDDSEWRTGRPRDPATGIIMLSMSRSRNIELLEQCDDRYVPAGIVRYIPETRDCEARLRNRFEARSDIAEYFEEVAFSALEKDPDIASVIVEWEQRRRS